MLISIAFLVFVGIFVFACTRLLPSTNPRKQAKHPNVKVKEAIRHPTRLVSHLQQFSFSCSSIFMTARQICSSNQTLPSRLQRKHPRPRQDVKHKAENKSSHIHFCLIEKTFRSGSIFVSFDRVFELKTFDMLLVY